MFCFRFFLLVDGWVLDIFYKNVFIFFGDWCDFFGEKWNNDCDCFEMKKGVKNRCYVIYYKVFLLNFFFLLDWKRKLK